MKQHAINVAIMLAVFAAGTLLVNKVAPVRKALGGAA